MFCTLWAAATSRIALSADTAMVGNIGKVAPTVVSVVLHHGGDWDSEAPTFSDLSQLC